MRHVRKQLEPDALEGDCVVYHLAVGDENGAYDRDGGGDEVHAARRASRCRPPGRNGSDEKQWRYVYEEALVNPRDVCVRTAVELRCLERCLEHKPCSECDRDASKRDPRVPRATSREYI